MQTFQSYQYKHYTIEVFNACHSESKFSAKILYPEEIEGDDLGGWIDFDVHDSIGFETINEALRFCLHEILLYDDSGEYIQEAEIFPLILVKKNSLVNKSHSKKRGYKHNAWAIMVKEKDGNACVKCGFTEDLHAHHLQSYKLNEALRYDINNGTTLCSICHREHHKINGK